MVRMREFNKIVAEAKEKFYTLTKHSFLKAYSTDPTIDDDKVRFLYAILQKKLPKKDTDMFVISSLLVQAALDVHESVTLNDVTSDFLRKNRQLTILAGDYYSSLYYYLLAENEHLPLLSVFSNTIQKINEYKMSIYMDKQISFSEVKRHVELIESVLLQKIADHFDQSIWSNVLKKFFYLKRLLFEQKEWALGNTYPLIRALQREVKEENIQEAIDEKANEITCQLIQKSKVLGPFETFVIEHIEQLIGARIDEKIGGKR